MKHIIKKLAALLCSGALLTAFTCPAISAEEETSPVLPSGLTIADVERELGSIASQNQSGEDYYAAALVGIFQGDDILYTDYFGNIDIANHIPADENTCFEWGSISKTFIWVSAFQLWEQGKLDLEQDVRTYLPEGFFQHLSYDEPITMLNLMCHNAGWQETTKPLFKTDENAIHSLQEELQALEPAQVSPPGKTVAYSNYGAAVAGYVIECVSGQDYCDYVHEHIFAPLGMEQTSLNPTHSDCDFVYRQRQKAHAYSVNSIMSKAIDLGTSLDYIPAYPAGAACGTITDMMKYGQALVDESAPLFNSPETQKLMLSGTDFYGESDIPMNCHGFWCTEFGVRAYGHTGGTLFGQADLEFDPVSKVGYAVMVNEPNGNDFLSSIGALTFGALDPAVYSAKTFGKSDIHGYFLPARSHYQGMLRFSTYLSGLSSEQISLADADILQNGVLQITMTDPQTKESSAALLGDKRDPANRLIALESPSCDVLYDRLYLVHLSLLTLFVLGGVSAVYMILIQHKLKRAKRWNAHPTDTAYTAGRIARLLSVVLMLSVYVVFLQNKGGIPDDLGRLLGSGQIVCAAVCGITAVAALSALLFRKQRVSKLRPMLFGISNVLSISAILFFQMYRFWM